MSAGMSATLPLFSCGALTQALCNQASAAVLKFAGSLHHIDLEGVGVLMHWAGYGNDASILGVPDIPIWLLRHDGELLCNSHCLACRLAKILYAWTRQLSL